VGVEEDLRLIPDHVGPVELPETSGKAPEEDPV
jgi:hypothetical protein